MSDKILQASVIIGFSLLSPLLAYPQAGTQSNASAQQAQFTTLATSHDAAPVLEIYNFALAAGAETYQQAQPLQQAIPDSLYLRFLADARIDVRRIRQPYTLAGSGSSNSRLSETAPHYVLDGKIAFMQGGLQSAAAQDHSAPGYVVITYSLHPLGSEAGSRAPLEQDETTNFAQLSGTLRRISGHVITSMLPPSKVSLQVNAPQFKDFPVSRQPFYSQNIPELLKTELSRQEWIDVVEDKAAATYQIDETLRAARNNNGYELQATISRGGVPIGSPLIEDARETEVLAAQVRLAANIIDAMKVNVALAPTLSGSSAQPSSDDFFKTAQTYEKTDPDLSIALYKRAILRDPSNTQAKLFLAHMYVNRNQTEESLRILDAPEFAATAYAHYLRSVAYTHTENEQAAFQAIDRAVELAPKQPICYSWRGYLFDRRKDYAMAAKDYEAARNLDPSDADYYESSARDLEKLDKYDEAIAVLQAGVAHAAEGHRLTVALNDTRRRVAAHYLDANNPAEGMRYAIASVKDDENSEWGQRLVGIAYRMQGKLPEAAKSLQHALSIQETVAAYTELARVRLEQRDKKEAFALAEKGIALDPNDTSSYGVLEKGVTGPDDAKEVVAWLKEYAAKNPSVHNVLIDWDYFQLIYRPNDPGELAALVSAYDAALKSLPYSDWLDGWANYVELSLIQGKYHEASIAADGILKVTPKFEYQAPLRFYSWVANLLSGDCVAAQSSLREFTDFLGRPAIDNFDPSWEFGATRNYLQSQVSSGALDANTYSVIQSALSVLESHPMKRTTTDTFLTKMRSLKHSPCSSRKSLSSL